MYIIYRRAKPGRVANTSTNGAAALASILNVTVSKKHFYEFLSNKCFVKRRLIHVSIYHYSSERHHIQRLCSFTTPPLHLKDDCAACLIVSCNAAILSSEMPPTLWLLEWVIKLSNQFVFGLGTRHSVLFLPRRVRQHYTSQLFYNYRRRWVWDVYVGR